MKSHKPSQQVMIIGGVAEECDSWLQESSEYETDSDEEERPAGPRLIKPVFVPKSQREVSRRQKMIAPTPCMHSTAGKRCSSGNNG